MSREVPGILEDLEEGVDEERAGRVLAASEELRGRLQSLLEGRSLEVEDPLLVKRRRLHQRLEVLEAKARAGRFEDAQEDLEAVAPMAKSLSGEIEARPPASTRRRWMPDRLRRGLLVARRETRAVLRGSRGPLVAGLAVLVFGMGLLSARASTGLEGVLGAALEPALVLGPLAGVLVGIGTLGDDVRGRRLPLVAGQGLSRAEVLAAKTLGRWLGLALVLLAPAAVLLLAGALLGAPLPDLSNSVLFLGGLVLSATSFAAIALVLEALETSQGVLLGGLLAAYIVLGPAWRQAFLAGSPAGVETLGAAIVYRASPIAAARWSLQTASGLGLLVLAAWSLAGLAVAGLLVQDRGLGRPPAPT